MAKIRFNSRIVQKATGPARILTPNGKRAEFQIRKFILATCARPASEVVIGDSVHGSEWSLTTGKGRRVIGVSNDGDFVRFELLDGNSLLYSPEHMIAVTPKPGAEWDALIAFARTVPVGLDVVE